MDKMKEQKFSGVITAFFSLVLLLVIALITTMAETARVTACSRLSETFLEISTKSLLGSYDLPLYENYHVFGRYCNGINEGDRTVLQEELEWYLQENMGGITWLDMYPENTVISDVLVLTDSNGAPFYEQVLQYAKYQDAAMLLEWVLESAGLLEQAEETGLAVQKKFEVCGQAAQAEEVLIRLAGCVDGFQIDGSSFARDWKGKIKTTAFFAKKMVPGGSSQERVLPGNSELYQAQKDNYCDPVMVLNNILAYRQQALKEQEILDRLLQEEAEIRKEYEYASVKDTAEVEELKELLEQKQEEIRKCGEGIDGYIQHCNEWLGSWKEEIQKTKKQSEAALLLLEELKEQKNLASEALQNFETELKGYQGKIPEELYSELKQENSELLASLQQENSMGMLKDIAGMENALNHNIRIFEQVLKEVPRATYDRGAALLQWLEQIQKLAGYMKYLNLEQLNFCYDEIRFPAGENGYGALIKQLVEYGFAGLILENPKAVSYGSMSLFSLPSSDYTGETEEKFEYSLSELFDWEENGIFFDDSGRIKELLETGADKLLEQILYLTYLAEHFTAYTDFISGADEGNNNINETAELMAVEGVKYQLEYILCGNKVDFDNLSSVIARIFVIRFAMNLSAVLCSRECRQQVKEAAAALVGFTGIGAVVLLMELLIELLWAAECAAVDTAALLRGGEVSFFTAGKKLPVKFSELLSFSKNFLTEKAENLAKQKSNGVLKNYEEYLWLFLLLEKKELRTLRTMDVVQQMVRLKYHNGFKLKDCVYSVSVKTGVMIPYRFLLISGLQQGKGIAKTLSYSTSY